VAFLAVGVSPAAASEPVEFGYEEAGLPVNCNPCTMVVGGESHINFIGVRVSTCQDTLTFEIYHNGTGHITYNSGAHDSGGACTRRACNGIGEDVDEPEFNILGSEETFPDQVTMDVRFCLDTVSNPNATGTHCTAPIAASRLVSHHYVLVNSFNCVGSLYLVETSWHVTGGANVDFIHL
jgi:hypothetical protein